MTEIASPSSFLSGAELVPPGQRDAKPRSGSVPSVPFGSLVSKVAQEKAAPARSEERPAPRARSKDDEPRPSDETGQSDKPAKADQAEKPVCKAQPRSEERRGEGFGPSKPGSEIGETEGESVTADIDAKGRPQDEKACAMPMPGEGEPKCDGMPTPVDVTAGPMTTPAVELPVDPALPPPSLDVTGGVALQPSTETPAGPALPPPALDVTGGVALLPAGNALPAVATDDSTGGVAEGDVPVIAPGVAGTNALGLDKNATVALDTLISSQKSQDLKPGALQDGPALPDADVAPQTPTGAKNTADLLALLPSRGGDGAAKGATADKALAEMPKTNFGDWINEFAFSQGAVHRSGDLVGSLDRALAALPTPHAGQDALRPTPLQMLPIEIGMQAVRGVKTFQIRLDPAELGRVDVKLEFKEDGEVKANLVVDRVETLAMLKRDANTLQQAFEQAGLRQSPDGLTFQLRDQQQGREGQRQNDAQGGKPAWGNEKEETGAQQRPAEFVMRRVMIPHSSLDLVI